jgi:hypothetical protein
LGLSQEGELLSSGGQLQFGRQFLLHRNSIAYTEVNVKRREEFLPLP